MKHAFANLPEFNGHELVSYFCDKETDLRGFIAIHTTKLGPATGGTRYLVYPNEQEALRDALRLSRAMTYKCALAGIPLGGGKAVIIANGKKTKGRAFLKSFAQKVNLFGGMFTTGEDVGMNEKDIEILSKYSRYINGKSNSSGSPSPWAAQSVLYAMKAASKQIYGTNKLKDRTVAIKGVGHVGTELCKLLLREGAKIYISDIKQKRVKQLLKQYPPITAVLPNKIHTLPVDIFSPCALSQDLSVKTVRQLKCKIVCGAANNQLATLAAGDALHKRHILYIPDYVANAGGLINVVDNVYNKMYDKRRVEQKVKDVEKTVRNIINISKKKKLPTYRITDALAEKIINSK